MYLAAALWGLVSRLVLGSIGIAVVLMLLHAVGAPASALLITGLIVGVLVIGYSVARVRAIHAALRGR